MVAEPSSSSNRKRDPEATRAAILAAAEELFLKHGFGETSTSAIAKQAGATKSLIHHHFGSKEELWAEVKQRRFEPYYSRQKKMLEETPEGTADLLRRSIEEYFHFLQKNPETSHLLAWRMAEQDSSCMQLEDELMALGSQRIEEAQRRGELRPDLDPLLVLKSFLALVSHWFLTRHMLCAMLGEDAVDETLDGKYLQHVLTLFFEGARPRT